MLELKEPKSWMKQLIRTTKDESLWQCSGYVCPSDSEPKNWLPPFISTLPKMLWQLLHLPLTLTCFQRRIKLGLIPSPSSFFPSTFCVCVYVFETLTKGFYWYNSHSIQFTHFKCKLRWVLTNVHIYITMTLITIHIFITPNPSTSVPKRSPVSFASTE